MSETITIQPDGRDGLSCVQRSILRYLLDYQAPPNCYTVIRELLAAPGCPEGMTAESIDAAILTMSHPALSHPPMVTYYGGSIGWDDGWIPGPVYRNIRLGLGAHALIEDCSHCTSWWADEPLSVRVPFALVTGCASWEIELDADFPADKHDQASRRLRCRSVHCLRCDISTVAAKMSQFRSYPELRECLTFIEAGQTPVGCSDEYVRRLISAGTDSADLHIAVALAHAAPLAPHGVLIGFHVEEIADDQAPQIYMRTLPSMRLLGASGATTGQTVLLLDQAASGRHIGQDLEMLQRNGSIKPLMDEGEGEAFALIVPCPMEIGSSIEELVQDVPFVPLALDKYSVMFSGDKEHTGPS